jgi:hypothetical protein
MKNLLLLTMLLLLFVDTNGQKLNLNVSTGYKFESFEFPIVFADVPLSVDLEYFPLNWLSVYAGYEKFSGSFKFDEDLNFNEHLSYSMPKMGINYYPIVFNRSRVFVGGFAGIASQQLNTINYIQITELYNREPQITGIIFGDYKKSVLGYGIQMGYSYQIVKDRFNIGVLFDYTKFDIKSNTFAGIFVSGQVKLGFVLF